MYFEDVSLTFRDVQEQEEGLLNTVFVFVATQMFKPELSLGPQCLSESFQLAVPRSVWCQWELFALHLKEGISITVLTEIITEPKKLLFATADACCQ